MIQISGFFFVFFSMIVNMNVPLFVEPAQRFTFRQSGKTVATGVVTKLLERQSEDMKGFKARKKLMLDEVEKLGFNPYGEQFEAKIKQNQTKKEVKK